MLKKNTKDNFTIWCGILCIVLVNSIHLFEYKVPSIIFDEIGYWTGAAWTNGLNWQGLAAEMEYYAYGSGLILGLLMRCFSDSTIVYHFALCINLLIYILIYLFSLKIVGFLNPMVNIYHSVLIAFLCVLYPTNIMNCHIAWSENYLTFCVWLVLFLAVKAIENKRLSMLYWWSSICVLVFSYAVHQRMIAACILCLVVVISFLLFESRDWKAAIGVIAIFVGGIAIHRLLKGNYKDAIWNSIQAVSIDEETPSGNDYGARIYALFYAFRNGGIQTLIRSFIGKMSYALLTSFGLGFFSLFSFRKIFDQTFCNKKKLIYILIWTFFIGCIAIDILACMEDGVEATRLDLLVYGRYFEMTMGPVLLISALEFYDEQNEKYCLWAVVVSLIASKCLYTFYETGFFVNKLFASCAGGLFWFYTVFSSKEYIIFSGLIVCIIGGIGMILVRTAKVEGRSTFLLCLILIFVFEGRILENSIYEIQMNNKRIIPIAECIKENSDSCDIFCIRGDSNYTYMYAAVLQYELPEYKVIYIDKDVIATTEISDDAFLLSEEELFSLSNIHKVEFDNYLWKIYQKDN